MSAQLHSAIQNILEMPYFKNEQARSGGANYGHEEAVAEKIKAAGFTEVDKKQFPKITKKMLKQWAISRDDTELRKVTAGLPEGTYILQPAGSQGFPDVLVKDWGDRFVAVECKSGKGEGSPMWNDNAPKSDAIYVYSSGSRNETTAFLGKDVVTPEIQARIDKLIEDWKKLTDQCKEDLKALDKFNRGYFCNARPQYNQGGGNAKTNYFTHASRQLCESNVLEYAKA